jgi:hypothetical protein
MSTLSQSARASQRPSGTPHMPAAKAGPWFDWPGTRSRKESVLAWARGPRSAARSAAADTDKSDHNHPAPPRRLLVEAAPQAWLTCNWNSPVSGWLVRYGTLALLPAICRGVRPSGRAS